MASLIQLYEEHGQSPWLDNLTRAMLRDGTMAGLVARGVRGVTANPTIVARAIESSDAYDQQFHDLLASGHTLEDAYWDLVVSDVIDALRPAAADLRRQRGRGRVRLDRGGARPGQRHGGDHRRPPETCTHASAHRTCWSRSPPPAAGVPAIEAMIAEGRSINVTLIFSLARYARSSRPTCPAWRALARRGGDLSAVHSVASFFVSRVDTEVDRRLETIGTAEALALRGRSGGGASQARLPALPRAPTPARGGNGWPTRARACNGRCGRRRRPRTPPTPTPCTSTASSGPTRSTPWRRAPCRRSRTTARSPARSTSGSAEAEPSCAPSPRRGSTWTTSGTPSRRRASPRSRHPSPTCSAPWRRRRPRGGLPAPLPSQPHD